MLDHVQDISLVELFAASRAPPLRSVLMESLTERVMRQIRLALFERMRNSVQIAQTGSTVATLESALAGAPAVMFGAIVQMLPGNARMVVMIDGRLIGAVVDGMCGASYADDAKRQELSPMEIRIGKQLVELTVNAVAEVWRTLAPLSLKTVQYETAPGMLAIADDVDWMIVTRGRLDTATGCGTITLICPYASFEQLGRRDAHSAGPQVLHNADTGWDSALSHLAGTVTVELIFEIARMPVPLGVVDALAPGQVLPGALLGEAILVVGGVDLLVADYGQMHGRICCRPRVSEGMEEDPMARKNEASVHEKVALEPLHPLVQGAAAPVAKGLVERVPVTLTVELGRTTIAVKDLRQLRHGQVVVLDQAVGEPLGIFANGHRIAYGEVVSVAKDQYGIRVTTLAEAREPGKEAAE
jgi:flagellar motor switch protein FliM